MKLKNTILLVFALLLLAGCGGSKETSKETKKETPIVSQNVDLNTFKTVYYEEIPILNPFNLTNTTEMYMTANTMDGLVENDNKGKFIPALAESWNHNDDYTVWTFKLREDMYYTNSKGEKTDYKITAADFVEGIRYIANPNNNVTNVKIARDNIAGFKGYYWDIVDIQDGVIKDKTVKEVLNSFDEVMGVKAVDEYTVEYTLKQPTPYFLSMLVTELFLPINRKFYDEVGDQYGIAADKLLYTGAYYFDEWQRDKSITLKANPEYWDKDNVNIEKIQMLKVADATIALEMFKREEIDAVTLDSLQVEGLKGTEYEKNIYKTPNSSVMYWFSLNFDTPNKEFAAFMKNDNFRKALYHGIDKRSLQQVFDAYSPSSSLANTIIPSGNVFDTNGKDYTDYGNLESYKKMGADTYNLELAREYMNKAIAEVAPNGNIIGVDAQTVDVSPIAKFEIDGKLPISLMYVDSRDADNIMMAELFELTMEETFGKDVIDVVLGQFNNSKYDDVVKPGFYDICYDSFSFKYADPSAQLGRLTSDGSVNDGKHSDTTVDDLVNRAMDELNLEKRYEKFAKAEEYLLEKGYIIPFKRAGGGYSMSRTDKFNEPYGGFGITRFKYKGISKLDHILSVDEYNTMKEEWSK